MQSSVKAKTGLQFRTLSIPGTHTLAVTSPAGPPALELKARTPTTERLVRQLAHVWIDFETRLHQIPIVAKLETNRFTRDDYKLLLLNLRQQVVDEAQ